MQTKPLLLENIASTKNEKDDDNMSYKSEHSLPSIIEEDYNTNRSSEDEDQNGEDQNDEDPNYENQNEADDDQNTNKNDNNQYQSENPRSNIKVMQQYVCKLCPKKFARKTNLVNHLKSHDKPNNPSKFRVCPFCGQSFPKANLTVHIRRHTGEKPFPCDQCDMKYVRRQELIIHKRVHTGEKPHICATCGMAFSRTNLLVRHNRTHTGERPYSCNQCDRSFAQRNDLLLHIRRHTGEKPYKCGICGMGFINGSTLKKHRNAKQHWEEDNRDRYEKIRVTNINRTCHIKPVITEEMASQPEVSKAI